MRNPPSLWVLVVSLLVLFDAGCATGDGQPPVESSEAEGQMEEAELAVHMSQLQRWTHKTTLALQARNPDLADFYMHEVEESVETIKEDVPTYEGYAIADRIDEILTPSVEALDGALDDRNWSAIDARLADLAQSCNQCHEVTDHGFIVIDLEDVPNPYSQEFGPGAE